MKAFKKISAIATMCLMAFTVFAVAQSKKPAAPTVKAVKKGDVYTMIDEVPKFPGGNQAFYKYLTTTVKYPAADRDKNMQGKVFVQFIVERDGSLTNVKAVRGPSETLKAEATRVISGSPKWIPGKNEGKVVRSQYVVPINFALNEE